MRDRLPRCQRGALGAALTTRRVLVRVARVSPTTAPGGARRPTLRDVARLAGVGVKTASRVVTEEGGVSPAKVEAVRAAVAELGYVPDAAARGLRRGDRRAGVVAVLLEDLSNPFSASVLRAVEDVVRPRGLVVVAGSLDEDPEQERRLVRAVLGRRTDGLVLMPAGGDHGWLARELEAPGGALLGGVLGRAVPVVFVDRAPVGVVADAVRADDRDGARRRRPPRGRGAPAGRPPGRRPGGLDGPGAAGGLPRRPRGGGPAARPRAGADRPALGGRGRGRRPGAARRGGAADGALHGPATANGRGGAGAAGPGPRA